MQSNHLATETMNSTLFDCGFKKEIESKSGQLYDITAKLSRPVKIVTKSLQCNFCQEVFSGKQYLDTYVRFKHSTKQSLSEPCIDSSNRVICRHEKRNESNDDATSENSTQDACGA